MSNGYRTFVLQLVVDFCHKDPYLIVPFYVSLFSQRFRGLYSGELTEQQHKGCLGTKNSKSKEGRQEKNGGVTGKDRSVEELDRETGEEHGTVGRARINDDG